MAQPVLVEYQIVLHIAMAGCFMYLLQGLRREQERRPVCGHHFMLCGFFTTHIFHSNLIYAAAWFARDYVSAHHRQMSLLTWRSRARAERHLFCGIRSSWCTCITAGRPITCTARVRMREKTRLFAEVKRAALFAGLVALGIGMSSVQDAPTQELAKNSVRPNWNSLNLAKLVQAVPFCDAVGPQLLGLPQKYAYWAFRKRRQWRSTITGNGMYAGTVSLALAAIAPFFVRTPSRFSFNHGCFEFSARHGQFVFLYWLAFNSSAFNAFRIPGRFAYMFSLSVSCLPGSAHVAAEQGPAGKRKAETAAGAHAPGCGGLCLVWGLVTTAGVFKTALLISSLLPEGSAQTAGNLELC